MAGVEFSTSRTFKVGARSFTIPTASVTEDSVVGYSGTIDAGTTSLRRYMTVTAALAVGVGIKATKALTIVTSGGNTFSIPANGGIVWILGDAVSCPITANFTYIEITNSATGSNSSELDFYVVSDQPGAGS